MRLKLLLPTQVLFEGDVLKVTAEAPNGFFTLLPRHIDFVSTLVIGLLNFVTEEGEEEFFAVYEGVLIKVGPEVFVSTRNAVRGPDLGTLEKAIEEQYHALGDRERRARSAVARLEADLVRRFLELRETSRG